MTKTEIAFTFVLRFVTMMLTVSAVLTTLGIISNLLFNDYALSERQFIWYNFFRIAQPFILVFVVYYMGKWMINPFMQNQFEHITDQQLYKECVKRNTITEANFDTKGDS
jgi:hypothetical protein